MSNFSGVVPNKGQFPMAVGGQELFQCTGPMCRYAEDLTPMLKVMAGPGIKRYVHLLLFPQTLILTFILSLFINVIEVDFQSSSKELLRIFMREPLYTYISGYHDSQVGKMPCKSILLRKYKERPYFGMETVNLFVVYL